MSSEGLPHMASARGVPDNALIVTVTVVARDRYSRATSPDTIYYTPYTRWWDGETLCIPSSGPSSVTINSYSCWLQLQSHLNSSFNEEPSGLVNSWFGVGHESQWWGTVSDKEPSRYGFASADLESDAEVD